MNDEGRNDVRIDGRTDGRGSRRRSVGTALKGIALTAALAVGFGAANSAAVAAETVTIATPNYSEPQILAEMIRQIIEDRTDVTVNHMANLGGSSIVHRAYTSGDAQLYVSYTGTQFAGVLNHAVTDEWKDPQKVYNYVKDEFLKRFDAVVFPSFGFENTYAVAVRQDDARRWGLEAVSDLRPYAPDMTAGTDQTFQEREGDGWQELVDTYGLDFNETVSMDYGLMYRAAGQGEVDAIVAYSTDARIKKERLTVLKDDLRFFPPYDAVLFARKDVAERLNLEEILEPLFGAFTEEDVIDLNYEADVMAMDPEDVARRYLEENGLL